MNRHVDYKDFMVRSRKIKRAGLGGSKPPDRQVNVDCSHISSIEERVRKIMGIVNEIGRSPGNMLCFIMYDIESNKVRRLIAKYLLRNGCTRVQRSIFLADLPSERYEKIRNELAEVQSAYENEDSILIVLISTDYLRSMKIIGKNINVDIITRAQNTLFF